MERKYKVLIGCAALALAVPITEYFVPKPQRVVEVPTPTLAPVPTPTPTPEATPLAIPVRVVTAQPRIIGIDFTKKTPVPIYGR